jgi:hypothetical protein
MVFIVRKKILILYACTFMGVVSGVASIAASGGDEPS